MEQRDMSDPPPPLASFCSEASLRHCNAFHGKVRFEPFYFPVFKFLGFGLFKIYIYLTQMAINNLESWANVKSRVNN